MLNINNLEFPSSLRIIGVQAFSSNLIKRVTISENVVYIGDGAFGDNPSLERIDVSIDNLKYISLDGVLYNKQLTELCCLPLLNPNKTLANCVKTLRYRSLNGESISFAFPPTLENINFGAIFRFYVTNLYVNGNINDINYVHEAKIKNLFYFGNQFVGGNFALRSMGKVFVFNYNYSTFAGKPVIKVNNKYQMMIPKSCPYMMNLNINIFNITQFFIVSLELEWIILEKTK